MLDNPIPVAHAFFLSSVKPDKFDPSIFAYVLSAVLLCNAPSIFVFNVFSNFTVYFVPLPSAFVSGVTIISPVVPATSTFEFSNSFLVANVFLSVSYVASSNFLANSVCNCPPVTASFEPADILPSAILNFVVGSFVLPSGFTTVANILCDSNPLS